MQQVYSRNLYSPARFWELNALWRILLQKYCSKKVTGQSDQLYCVLNLRAPHKMLLLLTVFNDHQWRNRGVMIPQDLLISNNLAWSADSTAALKVQQCLHFLRLLKKSCLDEKLLVAFYCSTIESILVYCVTVRYARCSAADEKAIQNILNTEKRPLAVLYLSWKRCHSGA